MNFITTLFESSEATAFILLNGIVLIGALFIVSLYAFRQVDKSVEQLFLDLFE